MALNESGSPKFGNVTNIAEARESRNAKVVSASTVEKDDPHKNRRFDAEKVARIKAEIAAGQYIIDSSRVADKFIEHERNQ